MSQKEKLPLGRLEVSGVSRYKGGRRYYFRIDGDEVTPYTLSESDYYGVMMPFGGGMDKSLYLRLRAAIRRFDALSYSEREKFFI